GPCQTCLTFELRYRTYDTGGIVLFAQSVNNHTLTTVVLVLGVVGAAQRCSEGTVVGIPAVTGTGIQQVNPHAAHVFGLTDHTHYTLGCRVTGNACQRGTTSRNPGVRRITGSRTRSRVVSGLGRTDSFQHFLEFNTNDVGRSQGTDTVHVFDGLVVRADGQVINRLPGKAYVP